MDSLKVSRSVMISSSVLLIIGIATFISAIVVIADSSGIAGGCWYVGVSAIVSGSSGLRFIKVGYRYIWLNAMITFILAIVGSVINASEYDFYSALEACAAYESDQSGNCGFDYYSCYGSSSYYAPSIYCEALSTSTDCSCVNDQATNDNGDGYTCYQFNSFSNCDRLLTSIPEALHCAYALCMITLFAALIQACLTATAAFKPQYIDPTITATTATIVQHRNNGTATTDVYVLGPGDAVAIQPATATTNPMTNNSKGVNNNRDVSQPTVVGVVVQSHTVAAGAYEPPKI